MFGIGGTELLVILVVALIVLGPKSVPQIARTLGKAMGEFRKVSTEFQRTLNTEIELEEHEKRKQEAEQELFGTAPIEVQTNYHRVNRRDKYKVTINLDRLFHIYGSPRADWTGQNVTIFYANRLGYYPHYNHQGVAVNGGLPQKFLRRWD